MATVPLTQIVVEARLGTVRPAGRVSLNAMPVSEDVLGLAIWKERALVPPTVITVGLKFLVRVGGAKTSIELFAVPPVPPSVELIGPVVLLFVPAVVPVTFTENEQLPEAASARPERPIELLPAAAVRL